MRHAITIAATAALSAAASAGDELPMNYPVTYSGIDTVCTGIGDAQDDPRWASYPIRVEFFNRRLQWTVGADVVLAKADGSVLTAFNCPGAWVLFRLAPGRYKLTAIAAPGPGGTVTVVFTPPKRGLKRVQLVFTSPAMD